MKRSILYSLLAVSFVLLLCALPFPAPAVEAEPESSAIDETLSFTVLTDTGVETVTMADYLPGVVAGEMPALFEPEALKAQAVAARTYILHRMERTVTAHPEADVCTSPACCKAHADETDLRQNWGSRYETYADKIQTAVTATDGQMLTYEGELIEAVFHSSSAGATEASAAIWNSRPYLVSVDSPETDSDVPNYITTICFTPEELKAELPDTQFYGDPSTWIRNLTLNDSGRVDTIQLGDQTFTGAQLRAALGLRSAAFTARYTDGCFLFTVTGYGHGVGMSQYGANVYAKQGWSCGEILNHYYPGTVLGEAVN